MAVACHNTIVARSNTGRETEAAVCLTALLLALPLFSRPASDLNLRWANISSGYSVSTGNGYRLAGTSGEIDGSEQLNGEGFQFTGGFWTNVEEPPPAPPPVRKRFGLSLPRVLGG